MSLKGNLNSVDLANIFQMLSINQKEGTLDIFDGETKKSIHFSPEGVSMLARGEAERDSLGRILLRFDQITEEQLDAALGEARESGRPLATVLRERGTVPAEVIDDGERMQIEEEIQNLFIWKDLTFEFREGTPPAEEAGAGMPARKITFNVNSLIMEAARRIDEWEQIKARVPSMAEIYRYTGSNMELEAEVFSEPWIDKVLGAIDGRRNVDEVVERSWGNRFEVCQVLSLLLEQGAIEPVPPGDLSAEAKNALAEGRTPEAVKFLERLLEVGGGSTDGAKVLGEAYERSGEIAKAARSYLRYAQTACEAGSVAEAFEYARRACGLLPTDLGAGKLMLDLFHEHSDRLGDRLPEVVERGKGLAACFFELKQHDKAIEVLKVLLEHAPEDFALRNEIVSYYLASGRAPAAVDEFLRMADWYTRKRDWEQVTRILRRVLSIDRSREDVYQRLEQILKRKQKTRRSLRHVALLGVLALCVGFLVYAYVGYEIDARRSISDEEVHTGQTFSDLEKEVRDSIGELEDLPAALAAPDPDVSTLARIVHRAEQLRKRYASEVEAGIRTLEKVAEQYRFSSARNQAVEKQQALRLARSRFECAVESARANVQRRAVEFAAGGERCLVEGHPTRALGLYRRAWELAADRTPFAEAGVDRIISSLTEDLAGIGERLRRIRELLEGGSPDTARQEALTLLEEYWLAEVLGEVEFPVLVESVPEGARVFLNGVETAVTTPGTVRWNPGTDAHLSVVRSGFLPATASLLAADPDREEEELARLKSTTRVVVSLRKEFEWETVLSGAVEAGAALLGPVAVLATRNGAVYRLEPASRGLVELHRFAGIGGIAATPAAAGDRVFAASVDGEVVALPAGGGPLLWSRKLPGRVYSGLASDGSIVVVADATGLVRALDASTGADRWQRSLPGETREDLAMAGDQVVAVTLNGHVCALAAATGMVRFDVVPAGSPERPLLGPAPAGGTICVATEDGRVFGLDAGTGQTLHEVSCGTSLRAGPVASFGAFLVVGEDGGFRAVRDGRVLDTIAVGAPGRVFSTGSGDFALVALEGGSTVAVVCGEDGLEPLWKVDLPGEPDGKAPAVAAAALAGESLVIATGSGKVYVIHR